MPERFHIGQRIQEVWKQSGIRAGEFASRIHRQRQAVYSLFKRESIDTDLLRLISQVLRHDFFRDYSQSLQQQADEPKAEGKPEGRSLQQLSGSIDQLSHEVKRLAEKKG